MKSSFLPRSRILLFFLLVFAIVLLAKLFLIQIVHSNFYTEAAERQYATPSGNIFERGTIYFTRKDGQLVSAATQTTGFKVAIDPTKITDAEAVFQKLSAKITLNHEDFSLKAARAGDRKSTRLNSSHSSISYSVFF